MEGSNPQVLSCPGFQDQLPSIQRHLPYLITETGGVEPLQLLTALLFSRQVAVLSAAASIQGYLTGVEPALTGSTNQRLHRFDFRHHSGIKETRTPSLLRARQAL